MALNAKAGTKFSTKFSTSTVNLRTNLRTLPLLYLGGIIENQNSDFVSVQMYKANLALYGDEVRILIFATSGHGQIQSWSLQTRAHALRARDA